MEILVTIAMGLLGAAATVYAAKLQNVRKEAQHQADEARSVVVQAAQVAPTSPALPEGETGTLSREVQATLIFPGSRNFHENQRTSFSYITVSLDGQTIGSGDGSRGFRLEFTTTVGLHDLVFMWDKDKEGFQYEGKYYEPRTIAERSELCVVFNKPGPTIVRLGYSSSFNVRHFEPAEAGYVAATEKNIGYAFAFGIGLIVVSLLILFRMFK